MAATVCWFLAGLPCPEQRFDGRFLPISKISTAASGSGNQPAKTKIVRAMRRATKPFNTHHRGDPWSFPAGLVVIFFDLALKDQANALPGP